MRRLVLPTVLLSSAAFPLTITGASLALADIQTTLGPARWVVNGYNIAFAACLVLAGSLADRVGKRRVYAAGVLLFCLAGAVSATAADVAVLTASRVAAGVGAAAAVAGGTAILAEVATGAARARALGLLGTVLGGGLAFGPAVGGLLVHGFGWRAVFALPAGLALVALVLSAWFPATPAGRRAAEPAGARSLGNPTFLAWAVAAGAFMAVLVPLLVYLPTYLITVGGHDAGAAGAWLLFLTVPTVVLPSVGARLGRPGAVVLGALCLTGLGALLLVTIAPDSGLLALAGPFLLVGSGVGLTTGLLDGLALGSVEPGQAGAAAGLFNTSRLATETASLAAVGALLQAVSGGALVDTTGLRVACAVLAGVAGLAAVLVVVLRRGTGARVA
ncbi:MFS transporter [Actinokineospora bangkokensis]|uniref:Major facilitator superfamily (MFS) profile domain-containing protein n=1 Tax=Actinokineospora bangkokensis TaxID=1193682 RepID=A0A1Q9LQP8_9PSEU|nr:MFS transporter [Actinokineospora bangkokensis]OLR94324.1 hypothetical protein BJP25_11180 [Actinokineospora bangkokensis]